jgi:hypothetical protein
MIEFHGGLQKPSLVECVVSTPQNESNDSVHANAELLLWQLHCSEAIIGLQYHKIKLNGHGFSVQGGFI